MYKQLTSEQRYTISVLLHQKTSKKKIAEVIGVHYSTIYREIKRNGHKRGGYGYHLAHEKACERQERLPGNRAIDTSLRKEIEGYLVKEDWSPKQISGYLSLQGKQVSHETIYRIIRKDKSGVLAFHCRHKMKYRHRYHHSIQCTKVKNIPNRVSIHQRPTEADGHRFGDWEMDLIIGKNGDSAILTLTERSTNFLMMERLRNGRKAEHVANTVNRLLFPYRGDSLKTITTDNGSEFACHEKITNMLGATVYFADSYSSWQKGAIENMNKLIRQYLPKSTDFNEVDDIAIKNIQMKINRRPREKLYFSTPKKEFFKHLI